MKLVYHRNLDGIRAIAALMVVVFHFFQEIKANTAILSLLKKISVFGQTGVTLFFVLSGFLITRILLNTKSTTGYFKNFYIRRTLRIFPLYYFFLILTYYILPIIFNSPFPSFCQQIYYYLYLQNFAITFNWKAVGPGHFWSLAVEEHFYLFWPFIIYFFSKKNLYRIIFGIIISSLLLRIYMLNNGIGVFYFTFTRIDALAIGSLLALLELKNIFVPKNANKFLMLLVSMVIPIILLWSYFTGEANISIQIFKELFISIIYFSIIGFLLCIKASHPVNKFLESKYFTFTGKISYGLYVYHPLAYLLCSKFMHFDYVSLNFIVGLALSYLMSIISFYCFENYFINLKNYFKYSKV